VKSKKIAKEEGERENKFALLYNKENNKQEETTY
jgi:hypothetical protein